MRFVFVMCVCVWMCVLILSHNCNPSCLLLFTIVSGSRGREGAAHRAQQRGGHGSGGSGGGVSEGGGRGAAVIAARGGSVEGRLSAHA
jgi:uncharacterized membrane protein YgcG